MWPLRLVEATELIPGLLAALLLLLGELLRDPRSVFDSLVGSSPGIEVYC